MGSKNIIKRLSTLLYSALLINLGIIEMSFGELQESNPGPIGEKR